MPGRRSTLAYGQQKTVTCGALAFGRFLALQPRQNRQRRWYHELSYSATGSSPADVLTYNQTNAIARDDDYDELVQVQKLASLSPKSASCCWVQVEVHYAPWNPADMNVVQGVYPSPYNNKQVASGVKQIQSSLYFPSHYVAGSEGIGRVTRIVHNNTDENSPSKNDENDEHDVASSSFLEVGDWVTFGNAGLGTMRSSLWTPRDAVLKLRRGEELFNTMSTQATTQSPAQLSTLFQLGGTALRMLKDFVVLDSDFDQRPFVVLQNAGNSGVGMMVSQLSQIVYPNTHSNSDSNNTSNCTMISFVRRGSNRTDNDMKYLIEYLKTEGKNHMVIVEDDILSPPDGMDPKAALKTLKTQISGLSDGGMPLLALNSVGGASSDLLLKLLGNGGTHVTYGGMSKQPAVSKLPTSGLIFKDLRVRGYWHSRWMVQNSIHKREEMVNELVDMVLLSSTTSNNGNKVRSALQCPPVQVFPLSKFKDALACDAEQSKHAIRSKIVFDCRE